MGPSELHSKTGFVVNGIKSELTTFIHTSLLKVSLVVMAIPTVGLAVGMSRHNNRSIGFTGGLANVSELAFSSLPSYYTCILLVATQRDR